MARRHRDAAVADRPAARQPEWLTVLARVTVTTRGAAGELIKPGETAVALTGDSEEAVRREILELTRQYVRWLGRPARLRVTDAQATWPLIIDTDGTPREDGRPDFATTTASSLDDETPPPADDQPTPATGNPAAGARPAAGPIRDHPHRRPVIATASSPRRSVPARALALGVLALVGLALIVVVATVHHSRGQTTGRAPTAGAGHQSPATTSPRVADRARRAGRATRRAATAGHRVTQRRTTARDRTASRHIRRSPQRRARRRTPAQRPAHASSQRSDRSPRHPPTSRSPVTPTTTTPASSPTPTTPASTTTAPPPTATPAAPTQSASGSARGHANQPDSGGPPPL
jgi:hypothetical protein